MGIYEMYEVVDILNMYISIYFINLLSAMCLHSTENVNVALPALALV